MTSGQPTDKLGRMIVTQPFELIVPETAFVLSFLASAYVLFSALFGRFWKAFHDRSPDRSGPEPVQRLPGFYDDSRTVPVRELQRTRPYAARSPADARTVANVHLSACGSDLNRFGWMSYRANPELAPAPVRSNR